MKKTTFTLLLSLSCRRWLVAQCLTDAFFAIQDEPLLSKNHRGRRCLLPALVFLFMLVAAQLSAQTELWGMTLNGAAGDGSIIKLNTDGSGFANYAFEDQGVNPRADLLESGGKFYGMTSSGGSFDSGVLFEYDPAGSGGGTYTVKHHFDGANGRNPIGSLMESGGKFYGMAYFGGSNDDGVMFEYDPAGGGASAGTYTVKHYFDGADGRNPYGSLIVSGGKFYGMTYSGGSNDDGVLFEYNPAGAGTYTVKHHFGGANGFHPEGSLITSGGKFYGMTAGGGSNSDGVLFEYDPAGAGAGTYTVKHHFGGANGDNPRGSLIASGGKFYGMAYRGGSNDDGVLFEYDPAGAGIYTIKHHFGGANGGNPEGSLMESGGKFYGMTYRGGSNDDGVLFEYDPAGGGAGAGIYTVKHHFDGANGRNPFGSLMESGGKFYGMTYRGGSNDRGVLFEYDPAAGGAGAGTFTVKHYFHDVNGSTPAGSLIASGGKFYGMTYYGGSNDDGVLFEYDPAAGGAGAGTYTVKHHFDGANGRNPYGSLMESGGKFYGMTIYGGSNGGGVIFEYDPAGGGAGAGAGTYTVKHHFDYTNGGYPHGSLIASGGKFYGMTNSGGSNDYGVLFEYNPAGAGTYTVKRHFNGANGGYPRGSLIASGGKFYGMTLSGGSNGDGVLFEYNLAGGGAGTYTVKHHFDGANGSNPLGSLIVSGGKFYGMTSSGGSSDVGVLFKYDPAGAGTYTVKHHFDCANGCTPYGSLIETGGKFYGMTNYDGSSDGGVVFEYDPAGGGAYTVLRYLQYADGTQPWGDLIAVTTVNTTTPAKVQAFEMHVSPNPSGNQVAVEIFSEKAVSGNLSIIDLQGRQVAELAKDRIFQGQERIVWQAADLPAGVYFLRLRSDAGVYTAKFVRQ